MDMPLYTVYPVVVDCGIQVGERRKEKGERRKEKGENIRRLS